MRCYLEGRPPLPPRVALVMTSASDGFPDKAFHEFATLCGRDVAARLHVPEKQVKAGGIDDALTAFVKDCGAA
jgi:hypothetical protein